MKNSSPLVSIIVPNYNHSKYLKQRLDSVFKQSYENFEVILLDDCSTDNSREILTKYAKNTKVSHCIFNSSNSGNTFIQWNKGISLAKGEYVWIAESDDFCELNFLESVLEPMLNNHEIVLSYCQSYRVNKNGIVTGSWLNHTEDLDSQLFLSNFTMYGNEFIERFLIYKNIIPNASAAVIKKKALDKLGSKNIISKLRYCGDWVLYFKLIANNEISYSAKLLNNFRYHSGSVIAKANKKENRITIIDIDNVMKKKVLKFLRSQNLSNFKKIVKINKGIINKLKYKKAILLIRNGGKVKGFILLGTVLDVFLKNYKFKNNLRIKLLRLFKLKTN
ncbi:glycosyltransferase family 2 protein [Lutibacter flavus]|uniref:Glycosyltransferase involved in cell wall bisynthesis n=1 Tax=Lutibacter flavus TaxID=691689 RepID=A0A238VQG7_9FLAO|nr:glycosyltransferase [Lutibacter flavus]SNR36610.1 Glycosyltransferase involved in cell wall bisynthesis [Lutibacter flavus]